MRGRRSAADLLARARSGLTRLEPAAAQVALAGGALLLDVRCGESRSRDGSVPGAVHVPLSVLPWRLDPASPFADPALARPERPVVLFCDHGYSSSLAAGWLRGLGFRSVADVVGGFEAWRATGLPVERPAEPE